MEAAVDDLGACPRCKTTKYRNPLMKLLVNVCGHSLCEQCVDVLFVRGTADCPQCGTVLRRQGFALQYFEDAGVQREVDIRRRVLRDLGRREEDFGSLDEYNDHLELLEDIIFKLTNNVQVEETKLKVDTLKKKYKAEGRVPGRGGAQVGEDEKMMEELLEEEARITEARRQEYLQEMKEKKRSKADEHNSLMDELIHSSLPANHVLAKYRMRKQHRAAAAGNLPDDNNPAATEGGIVEGLHPPGPRFGDYAQGIVPGDDLYFAEDEGKPFVYKAIEVDLIGPRVPALGDLDPYLEGVQGRTPGERAGGYTPRYECQRALQAAFSCLSTSDVK